MASRTRLKVPELDHDSNTLEYLRAHKDMWGNQDFLVAAYEVSTTKKARELLMLDLLHESCLDAREPPTSHRLQCAIVNEFRKITGTSYNTAKEEFNHQSKQFRKVLNIGMMTNFAATAKSDVISRMYGELVADEARREAWSKASPQERKNLERPFSPSQRVGMYKAIAEVADTITSMGIKQDQNDQGWDKNRILEKKVDSDRQIGEAEVALQIGGLSREEKERLAIEAIMSDKTLLNPIFDQIAGEVEQDGDYRVEVVDD